MANFKKHSWIPYGSFINGDTIEVTIRDGTGQKIDFMKCNDNQGFTNILNILRSKYNFYYISSKPNNKIDIVAHDEAREERERLDNLKNEKSCFGASTGLSRQTKTGEVNE
jgi:hypothetical protein